MHRSGDLLHVAERLQAKQIRSMFRVVEDERSSLIDWYSPTVGGGIRLLASMQLKGLKLKFSCMS